MVKKGCRVKLKDVLSTTTFPKDLSTQRTWQFRLNINMYVISNFESQQNIKLKRLNYKLLLSFYKIRI